MMLELATIQPAELSMRAIDRGYRLGVQRSAEVLHHEGGSSGGRGPSSTFYYYVQRNRLRVYRSRSSILGLLVGAGVVETLRLLVNPFRLGASGRGARFLASVAGLIAGVRGETGVR